MSITKTITVNAQPVTIGPQERAEISQTHTGFMILTVESDPADSAVEVSYSSGGDVPQRISIEAGTRAPSIVINDWNGNNLTVTNLSNETSGSKVNVKVGLYSYGSPTLPLEVGKPVNIGQYESTGGRTMAQYMNLKLSTPAQHEYTVFYVFSSDKHGKPGAYCVNAPDGTNVPNEYQKTKNNYVNIQNNWLGNSLFIVNASNTSGDTQVQLAAL